MDNPNDNSWNLKWLTSVQDHLIECLSQIRKHRHPTQEQAYHLAKARDCFNSWKMDYEGMGWVKTKSEHQLPPKVIEQQKHLEENQTDISKD